MLTYVIDLFAALARALKPWLLDVAHPLPKALELHHALQGLNAFVLHKALEAMPVEGTTVLADSPGVEEGEVRLLLGEETVTAGVLTVAKYLGRLWRTMPSTPESALRVDAQLDALQTLMARVTEKEDEAAVLTHLAWLEGTLSESAPYLGGFVAPTVADVCCCRVPVAGGRRTACPRRRGVRGGFPKVAAWWDRMLDGEGGEAEEKEA